jgi:hypothetical protein
LRLQQLIRDRKAALGDPSYEELARRGTQAGYRLTKSNLYHLATTEWKNFPDTETIFAIAAALACDPDEVLNAAAESVGIKRREVPTDRHTRAWLALVEDRSPEEIEHLQRIIETITETDP